MDPDATLKIVRKLVERVRSRPNVTAMDADAHELAGALADLDTHLSKSSFLPADWSGGNETCGSAQCVKHGSPTNFAADQRCRLDRRECVTCGQLIELQQGAHLQHVHVLPSEHDHPAQPKHPVGTGSATQTC